MPARPTCWTALPAFWVGLLYDQTSLDAAWDLVKGWSDAERRRCATRFRRKGLPRRSPAAGWARSQPRYWNCRAPACRAGRQRDAAGQRRERLPRIRCRRSWRADRRSLSRSRRAIAAAWGGNARAGLRRSLRFEGRVFCSRAGIETQSDRAFQQNQINELERVAAYRWRHEAARLQICRIAARRARSHRDRIRSDRGPDLDRDRCGGYPDQASLSGLLLAILPGLKGSSAYMGGPRLLRRSLEARQIVEALDDVLGERIREHRRSKRVRSSPILQDGKVVKPSEGPRMRMPGLTALSGSTETASPASTAAPTAVEFQLA